MNALILAAGLGTRLRPLTDTMPKALVTVGGQTLLERLILRLRADGFDHLVVNVHHFADQIISFLDAHNRFGLDIRVSDESAQLLDTGGAIKQALPLFPDQEPVLIHNVDILHNVPLRSFYLAHRDEADATLLVSQRSTARYLAFHRHTHQLQGWANIKTGETKGNLTPSELQAYITADGTLRENALHSATSSNNALPCATSANTTFRESVPVSLPYEFRAFAGIHLFSPRLLPLMQTTWPARFSVIDFYLQACQTHTIHGTEWPAMRLLDVGKLDSLAEAEAWVKAEEDM